MIFTKTPTKVFLLFSILMAMGSCQKTGDLVDPPTAAELIVDGAWILVAQDVDPAIEVNNVLITNEYNQLEDCEKDDLVNYNESGSFTFEEGPTKCDPADPQIYEAGTWSIDSAETALQLVLDSVTLDLGIEELSRDDLILTQTWTVNSTLYTRTFSFEHE